MKMPRGGSQEEQANEKRYPLVPDSLAKANGLTIEGKVGQRYIDQARREMSFYQMAMEMSAIIYDSEIGTAGRK